MVAARLGCVWRSQERRVCVVGFLGLGSAVAKGNGLATAQHRLCSPHATERYRRQSRATDSVTFTLRHTSCYAYVPPLSSMKQIRNSLRFFMQRLQGTTGTLCKLTGAFQSTSWCCAVSNRGHRWFTLLMLLTTMGCAAETALESDASPLSSQDSTKIAHGGCGDDARAEASRENIEIGTSSEFKWLCKGHPSRHCRFLSQYDCTKICTRGSCNKTGKRRKGCF